MQRLVGKFNLWCMHSGGRTPGVDVDMLAVKGMQQWEVTPYWELTVKSHI